MIQYQILQTNMTRTVWHTHEILGVKGLNSLRWPEFKFNLSTQLIGML